MLSVISLYRFIICSSQTGFQRHGVFGLVHHRRSAWPIRHSHSQTGQWPNNQIIYSKSKWQQKTNNCNPQESVQVLSVKKDKKLLNYLQTLDRFRWRSSDLKWSVESIKQCSTWRLSAFPIIQEHMVKSQVRKQCSGKSLLNMITN